MKLSFIHPTVAQLLKLASFVLVIVNTILAFGATIHTIPGVSPTLAACWPVIYGVAFGLHQLASNFGIVPDATFQAQVSGAVQSAEQAVATVESTEATIAATRKANVAGNSILPALLLVASGSFFAYFVPPSAFGFLSEHFSLFAPILAVLVLVAINAVPVIRRRGVPVLSFVGRYWKLVIFNVLLVQAALSDGVFATIGHLVYLPAVGSSLLTCTLLLRHLFFHQTLDADAVGSRNHPSRFVTEWRALHPELCQKLTCWYFAALFIGLALVAAAVGK